jgi:hypothetical protein
MVHQATEMLYLAERMSEKLYAQARARARRGRLWAALTGRSRRLLALTEIEASHTVRARHQAGVRTVAIDQIRGSENRSDDFDQEFYPLHDHNKRRWLSIAEAWERGTVLPPVELIEVGGVYFVRDGHHRISLARTLGQQHIEAQVVTWQVDGPLPRENRTRATRWSPGGLLNAVGG